MNPRKIFQLVVFTLAFFASLKGFSNDSAIVKRQGVFIGAGFFNSNLVESAQLFYTGLFYGRHSLGIGLMNGTTRYLNVWAGSGGWPLNIDTRNSKTKSLVGGSLFYRLALYKGVLPLNLFLEPRVNFLKWQLGYAPFQKINNLDFQLGLGIRVCFFKRIAFHFNPSFGYVKRYGANPLYYHSYYSGRDKKFVTKRVYENDGYSISLNATVEFLFGKPQKKRNPRNN